MHPFDDPGEWFRCALHAHTTNSDGELAPELLVRHYEWAGYDVLAITDHWVRTDEPSTPGLLVIPSAELNAIAPAREDDAHVLALGLEVDPVIPELEFAPLQEVVSWIARERRRRPISPTPTGAACAPTSGRSARACSGSRSGTPAASSSSGAAMPRCTGTRRSNVAGPSTRSRPTTRTTPASTAASPGRGCAPARRRRRPCSTRSAPARSTARPGPRIDAVEVTDGDVIVRCSPAASVTLYTGRRRGARVNAGRLGYRTTGRCSSARTTA